MRNKTHRSKIVAGLLVACGLFWTARGVLIAEELTPEATVKATAAEVIEVLAGQDLTLADKKEHLETYLDSCCDFETTGKLVLGRNVRKLSDEDRAEFTRLFREYLEITYGKNIEDYNGETVEILGGRDEARGDYTVHIKVNRGGGDADILVDFRMRKSESGHWQVIDVVAEGISLVANLRSQFQEIVTNEGTEGLMEKLRDKVSRGDAAELPDDTPAEAQKS